MVVPPPHASDVASCYAGRHGGGEASWSRLALPYATGAASLGALPQTAASRPHTSSAARRHAARPAHQLAAGHQLPAGAEDTDDWTATSGHHTRTGWPPPPVS